MEISICQQIPHGGVSAIQETPSAFSMGNKTNDLGCHVGEYCESVTEMQIVTLVVYTEILLGGNFAKKMQQKKLSKISQDGGCLLFVT